MSLLNKILPNDATKTLLESLEKETKNFITYETNEAYEYSFNFIKKYVKETIYRDPNENEKAFKKLGAKKIIYRLIVDMSSELLASGRYHVYSGIIEKESQGDYFYKIFEKALSELTSIGGLTEKESIDYKKDVDHEISIMG
ncbi:MAG: hypothetical protein PHQ18_00515 [Patescibacteria group bacterium]|nr:hypothetical protein [Patescibacteria group bacterium]